MAWLPNKTVVVPIDFSEQAAHAVRVALEIVKHPADVHALYVLLPMENLAPDMAWGTVDDESRRKSLEHQIDAYREQQGFGDITTVVRIGDPGLEISDYASESRAGLIVIPSHGYHGLKRLVLGSVAERVMRHAGCPVLILKREETDPEAVAQ